jgi:hypothetical protein
MTYKRYERFDLLDPISGDVLPGSLGRTLVAHDNECDMVEWIPDDSPLTSPPPVSIIRYFRTGLVFSPADWETQQPLTLEDIADWQWMDGNGRPAIILDGWPVRIC